MLTESQEKKVLDYVSAAYLQNKHLFSKRDSHHLVDYVADAARLTYSFYDIPSVIKLAKKKVQLLQELNLGN